MDRYKPLATVTKLSNLIVYEGPGNTSAIGLQLQLWYTAAIEVVLSPSKKFASIKVR